MKWLFAKNLLCENNVQVSIHQSVTKGRERVNKCVTSFMDYELKSGSRLAIHDVVFFWGQKSISHGMFFWGNWSQSYTISFVLEKT